ncbi:MAG TPA: preprotein translocase subunit SecG [Candidatus Sulfotelmatobacter sp.]|nr:preprotein translocase subunit SecG [Candidatus Sulfotelmatobacter sp.]HWI58500.1 preprotein translocase subunit SecG [Bacillota bacterium]
MGFIIGLLTIILVLDCVALIFLVLIQLPKKEAGAGLAFGGAATDALFGAGSGTVLTKITKYAAIVFFVLAMVLSIMQSRYHRRTTSEFERRLEQPGRPPAGAVAPGPAAPAPATTPTAPTTGTNVPSAPAAGTPAPVVPTNATAPK